MLLLFFFFFLALGVSFLCSLLESVLLSVRRPYIAILVKEERRSGRIWTRLRDRVNHPLAAILALNTIANTLGAAGVGAQVSRLSGSDGQMLAIASGVLTFSILVFSEIIPKTLGASYWKSLGPLCAYLIQGMIWFTYPIVLMLETISRRLTKTSGLSVTRDEFTALADIAEAQGTLTHEEAQIVRNLVNLEAIKAQDIMTPRAVLVAFPEDKCVGEVLRENPRLRFSRLPVYASGLDDVQGIVLRHRIYEEEGAGRAETKLADLKKEIHAVPETKGVGSLLEEFLERQCHLFLVVDEYGGTAGIVTLEDVIETLLSAEIVDELDPVTDMRKLALDRFRARRKELDL